ncbi:large ribosomal subunit protein P1-like [Camelus dromedarius]|uniref:large ribosomal subunit protein P1-like n=1 Tax=Camelus dromedarius TaxID=9838 RepID=UPI00311A0A6A
MRLPLHVRTREADYEASAGPAVQCVPPGRDGVRPSLPPATSTAPGSARLELSRAAASVSGLACIYSALILHDEEVTVTEDKINALIKAAGAKVEPLWPGLFAKALAGVGIGSLLRTVGAGGPAGSRPAGGHAHATPAPAGGPAPAAAAAAPAEKKVDAKKEEAEESDDDMGFGLFD